MSSQTNYDENLLTTCFETFWLHVWQEPIKTVLPLLEIFHLLHREILMTASETIKTPQMDVLIKAGKETEAKQIAKQLTKLKLIDVSFAFSAMS